MSDLSSTSAEASLSARIDSEKGHPLAWKAVLKRAAVVVAAGVTIYLVFPAITEVLASWPRLSTLHPWWFSCDGTGRSARADAFSVREACAPAPA